ncbi:platelet-derived growth factor subunit A-like isoform X1 [Bacillus rossius redtenbacheri]|uniref:platelet-derived growth factor subunit A-like isoform X1 n=1 Tax=Bacillus rossius redtenbacheri TaxID=93214 RepID=UPI002FDD12BD
MAGACRLVLALALCCVRRAAAHEDVRLRLGRVDSVAALLGVLAPSDGRLCDEELLQQLEGDTEASQEELSNLRAVCNATKAEFTRAFPVIGGRALMPAKSVNPHMLKAMKKVFKKGVPRSRCKLRTVVEPLKPASTSHYYLPRCLTAKRCTGCCDLEMVHCEPDATRTSKRKVRPPPATTTCHAA